MAAVTLSDILFDLNYLLGDSAIPTSGTANQIDFVNRVIEDIYDRAPWTWAAQAPTTLQFSGTSAALSGVTNFDGSFIDVRKTGTGYGNDNVYSQTDAYSITNTDPSQFLFGVSGNKSDGFTMYINQTSNPLLQITPKYSPDTLAANADKTRIPRSMPIAVGALYFMQRTRNPFGDLSIFKGDYEAQISQLIRSDTSKKPKKQFYTGSEASRRPIGQPRHV